MDASYVELHVHSNFSLLNGASHPDELITRAEKLGYQALALTDHNSMGGALLFGKLCHEAGIRPITGVELTVEADTEVGLDGPRHHLTLLASTRAGYANICRLISLAHGRHLTTHAEREQRRRDPCASLKDLVEHTEGVICLTGCREGPLAQAITARDEMLATQRLSALIEWFGLDNVYVELMQNWVYGDRERNRKLIALAQRHGINVVATGDVHYHDRSRARLLDALVSIGNNTTLDESQRFRRPNSHFALRSPAEQTRRFAAWPGATANTEVIAARCAFDITNDLGYRLPSPRLSHGENPQVALARLCRQAIAERYPEVERPAAIARLDIELGLIERHGLAGFFLIYHEVFELARDVARELRGGAARASANLPPGRGRGSSVGSIVCYLIGLSHIDPVMNNLYLGRFLNDEMTSLPDIDIDFPRDIRARLFERIFETWGSDHAALVATYPTYRIRSAIRDLGKVLGLPASEVANLARIAEGYGSAAHIREEMETNPRFAKLVDAPGWRDLIELGGQLAGFPRHLSQHVGGVVISSDRLVDCVPVIPARWPNRYICQWEKDAVDDARMVKIDVLGLGMLSLVEECVDAIASTGQDVPDLSRIDYHDQRVFDRVCVGDTIGVFQIESRAQAGMLPRSQPRCLDDLAAQVAIVRPGPITGGAVHPYLKRRERMRAEPGWQPAMPHPLLEGPLRETLGVVLYQEQVVQCAVALAGWTTGRAEEFRRAMGRRTWPRVRDGFHDEFCAGAAAMDVKASIAESVFGNLEGFAEFGFPKSHSVAFALLAYQSAWLREYHPAPFYCALLNQWPMGFYPPHVVANDAQRHGVPILRPDVNASAVSSHVMLVDDVLGVRLGLRSVDSVGESLAQRIFEEREQRGRFGSLFDLIHRAAIAGEAAESLIRVGACDELGFNRRELIWELGLLGGRVHKGSRSETRQMMLALPIDGDRLALADFDDWERMIADYDVLRLSPDSHPATFLRSTVPGRPRTTHELSELRVGSHAEVFGLVVCRQRPMTAKGVVFLVLEDELGLVNVVLSAQLFDSNRSAICQSAFLKVVGTLTGVAGRVATVRADHVIPIAPRHPMAAPATKSWG